MYLGTRVTPIIVMVIIIGVIVGGVVLYNYMASQSGTITTTLTETTTVTKYSTVTITAGSNVTSTATLVKTTTATVTTTIPVTIIKTVTVTTLPPQPPKTTTTTTAPGEVRGENFTVDNVQVYSTTTSLGLIGLKTPKPMVLLKIPKNTAMEDIMNRLNQLVTEGVQVSSNMSVSISQAYDPAIVVMLSRGTPCTMYRVIVNDGNASDGRISLTIQKYSTADYCIQVVPKDNLYIGIIVLRNLQVGQYVVDVTLDYGTTRTQYTLDISYS